MLLKNIFFAFVLVALLATNGECFLFGKKKPENGTTTDKTTTTTTTKEDKHKGKITTKPSVINVTQHILHPLFNKTLLNGTQNAINITVPKHLGYNATYFLLPMNLTREKFPNVTVFNYVRPSTYHKKPTENGIHQLNATHYLVHVNHTEYVFGESNLNRILNCQHFDLNRNY